VQSGRQRLRVSATLADALDYFCTRLSLVGTEAG